LQALLFYFACARFVCRLASVKKLPPKKATEGYLNDALKLLDKMKKMSRTILAGILCNWFWVDSIHPHKRWSKKHFYTTQRAKEHVSGKTISLQAVL
jgi:hypothetical protein